VKEARLSIHERCKLRTTHFDTETTFQTETKFLLPRPQSVKTLSKRISPQIPVEVSRHARLKNHAGMFDQSPFSPWGEWGQHHELKDGVVLGLW
jgi:hypothetical protein